MSGELEDHRGLSRVQLEIKCDILEAQARGAMQIAQNIKNLVFRRIRDLAAEATTEPDARVLPVPAAGGSGQHVQVSPPSGPSARRSAAEQVGTSNTPVYRGHGGEHRGSILRDRGPGMERSAHTRANRDRDSAPTRTQITYVSLSLSTGSMH